MGLRRYLNWKNWYSNEVIFLLKREPQIYLKTELQKGHSVRFVTKDNIADTQVFEKKSYTTIYKKMLEHGDLGVYGYINDKCSARLWGQVNPSDVTEGGLALELEDESVFIHYIETSPLYRRQGIAKECLGLLVDECQNKTMYVTININNEASLRLHKNFGFKEISLIQIKRRHMQTRAYKHMIG